MQKLFSVAAIGSLLFVVALFVTAQRSARSDERPAPDDLKPIGGRWFVKEGAKPIYFYRDGERYVDLFSYHTKDSNKDGVVFFNPFEIEGQNAVEGYSEVWLDSCWGILSRPRAWTAAAGCRFPSNSLLLDDPCGDSPKITLTPGSRLPDTESGSRLPQSQGKITVTHCHRLLRRFRCT